MNPGKLVFVTGLTGALLVVRGAAAEGAPPAPAVAPAAVPVSGPPATAAGTTTPDTAVGDRALPEHGTPEVEGIDPVPGGLTAKEVARRALAVSPSVKEKRAQVTAANEKINQTMIQFFPKLTFGASYTHVSNVVTNLGGALVGAQNAGFLSTGPCPPGSAAAACVVDSAGKPAFATAFIIPTVQNQYSVDGHLSIPLSDYLLRLADAAASSKAGSASAKSAVVAEELKVASDSEKLYFNWLRARAQVSIAKSAVQRTEARLQDARATFTVGAISKADLMRIEALVANTELTLNQSESFAELTTGQLAIVMEDWHPNYHVGEGIPEPSQIPAPTEPLQQLIREAQARRLEVRAVEQAISANTHGASATRSGAIPRVDGFADGAYANPNQRYFPPQPDWHLTWDVGVRASWTINDTFQSSSAAREIDANALELMQQRTAVRAGIASEVLGAYLELGRARVAIEKQQAALASAEEGYRVTTDLFRAGRATSTDVIESESQLLEAKLGNVNDRIDLAVAAIALRHATGQDVPTEREARD